MTPPKPRTPENKGLPTNWRFRRGLYFYRVPPALRQHWDNKKEFRLGRTLPEAYKTWAERADIYEDAKTIAELLDRYIKEVSPTKSPNTFDTEIKIIAALRKGFGEMDISALRPMDVYKMRDKVGRRSESLANQHVVVLSHAYTKAIEWGYIDFHPIKGKVLKFGAKARTRYVEDWELAEFLEVANPMIKTYVTLKLKLGIRKGDMLTIQLSDIKAEGLLVVQNKTGKKIMFTWDDELREAVADVRAIKRKVGSMYLFATRAGKCYLDEKRKASGFDSVWRRSMDKALEDTELVERFTESDIRAKAASDATEAEATDKLDHSTPAVTRAHYRRKGKVVTPFSRSKIEQPD